jgi:predicted transcriptional regulator
VSDIRNMAIQMAQELDIHVDRAERAIRNLLKSGLIKLVPDVHGHERHE